MKKLNIKILVCNHKEYQFIKNDCIIPIHVGKSLSNVELNYCISDNTGDNISYKNQYWCELTALYWAWKNLDADYYGLMHYRRYLSFEDNTNYSIITSVNNEKFLKDLSCEKIQNMCQNYDIITSPVWKIHPVGLENCLMSSYEFYCKEHIKSDIDVTISVIKEKFPEYYYATLDYMSSNYSFFMNIMVLKKELFDKYCVFLFGVLEEVEKRIDLSNRDSYQKRVFGFIAERLSNIFVLYCQRTIKSLRIKQTGLYFLAEANEIDAERISKQVIERENRAKNAEAEINVCMSFDDNYLKYGLSTITSVLLHTNSKVNFYLLSDSRLSEKSRALVIANMRNNGKVNFVDIEPGLLDGLPLNRSYISINTYYRLLIHDLIKVDKIIYLDSDVIVCDDLVNLWNIDISNACIAGALDEGGVMQARRLSLGANANYLNAGVLVFNLKQIRKKYNDALKLYLETFYLNRKFIVLQDQDILNIAFKDDIKVIPLKWNINGRIFEVNELDFKYSKNDIMDALNDTGIIHYTDRKKPWKFQATHPLKNLYWHYRCKVLELPLDNEEKRNLFIQKHVQYKKEDTKIFVESHGLKLQLDKEWVKSLMRICGFKF